MIGLEDRVAATTLIAEAVADGARLAPACAVLEISPRTYRRWCRHPAGDRRPMAQHPAPDNKLSEEERAQILAICHRPEHAAQSPAEIVPVLADAGAYVASESSFYRVLRRARELAHRGRARAPHRGGPPRSHCAVRPCQIWTWDVTWLKGPVHGLFFYLYLIIDLFSRKIVGWEVWEEERADHAVVLIDRATLAEGCRGTLEVLHGDNGAIQKAATLRVRLAELGVAASFNRPGVSNDNAYSESVFRTCKYRPDYPDRGFATVDDARAWVAAFVAWYNNEHKHSGISYVTPVERHTGRDVEILAQRATVYAAARAQKPARWSRTVRDWSRKATVHLNRRSAEADAK